MVDVVSPVDHKYATKSVPASNVLFVPLHIVVFPVMDTVGFALTVIVNVVLVAHWPESGVNVYSVVAMLFKAGDHVPVILFKEVVGRSARGAPGQISSTGVKAGMVKGRIVVVTVAEFTQPVLLVTVTV